MSLRRGTSQSQHSHEKGDGGEDPAGVEGMIHVLLSRMHDGRIDQDPPACEELQEQNLRTSAQKTEPQNLRPEDRTSVLKTEPQNLLLGSPGHSPEFLQRPRPRRSSSRSSPHTHTPASGNGPGNQPSVPLLSHGSVSLNQNHRREQNHQPPSDSTGFTFYHLEQRT